MLVVRDRAAEAGQPQANPRPASFQSFHLRHVELTMRWYSLQQEICDG